MLTQERIMLIGETVHTDASADAIVVGRIVGWTEKGFPKVKLDRDPSVTSRVGGKSVVEAVPYHGELLPESGLPFEEREDGAVMCWFPDASSDGLTGRFDDLEPVGVRGIAPEPDDDGDLTDDELALMVENGEGLEDDDDSSDDAASEDEVAETDDAGNDGLGHDGGADGDGGDGSDGNDQGSDEESEDDDDPR